MPVPQLLASLGPFGGADTTTDATRVLPPKGVSVSNVVPFRVYGAYVTSQGRTRAFGATPLPGTVQWLSNPPGSAAQIGGALPTSIWLAGINSGGTKQIYLADIISGYTQVPFAGGLTITKFFNNQAIPDIHPGGLSPSVFIPTDPPTRIAVSDGKLHPWQYNAPNAAPTLAVGGGTGLTGTYFYVVTFVSTTGGTQETSPSPISLPITVNNTGVTVSNIPTSVQADIGQRNIYRIGGTLGTFFLVKTLNDNVTTSFTDNLADLSITGQALVLHRDPPPAGGFAHIESHKGRCWGINSDAFNTATASADLWYSGFQEFFSWDNVNGIIPIGEESESLAGDYGVGLASVGSVLAVFKAKSLWVVYGDSPADPFLPRKIADFGCIAVGSIAKGEGQVGWLSPQGVFLFDGNSPTYISRDIKKYLDSKTATQQAAACAWWFNKCYYISFPDDNTTWFYSLESQDWWQLSWSTNFAMYDTNSQATNITADPTQYVLVNDTAITGQIDFAFSGSENDKTSAIVASYTGKIDDGGAPTALKRYRFVEVVLTPLVAQTVSIQVQVDPLQGGATCTFAVPAGVDRVVFSMPVSMTGRSAQLTLSSTSGPFPGAVVQVSAVNLYGWIETALGKVS